MGSGVGWRPTGRLGRQQLVKLLIPPLRLSVWAGSAVVDHRRSGPASDAGCSAAATRYV